MNMKRWVLRLVGAAVLVGAVLVTLKDSNTVTISKASAVGSNFTAAVVIQRPHSILAHIA